MTNKNLWNLPLNPLWKITMSVSWQNHTSHWKTALFQSICHFNLMTHGIIKKTMQEVKQPTRCEAQKAKGPTQGHTGHLGKGQSWSPCGPAQSIPSCTLGTQSNWLPPSFQGVCVLGELLNQPICSKLNDASSSAFLPGFILQTS